MKKIFIFLCISSYSYAQQLQVNPAAKTLDKNNVKANIYMLDNKFWNIYGNGRNAYEVPKGRGSHAMFANSVWIGGLDAGGQLHIAANTYQQNGTDYRPGPLDTVHPNSFNSTNSALYNKLWKVDCNDISSFVNAFNSGLVTNNTYTVPDGILNYPGDGTANFQKQMAPYFDANSDGIYNPQTHGDYPLIKGQQEILSIFNDNNSAHTETDGRAMGLEIHQRSYAYTAPAIIDTMQAINYTTFYNYTIYNRSDTAYHHVYITDWSDVDLGYFLNDYIGTDTVNKFAYCYNYGTNDPASQYSAGYLNKLPVLSHALITTDCSGDGVDNNNNGQIDEAGEQFNMDRVTYYNNNIGNYPQATINPFLPTDYYNYMSGFWLDGSPFTNSGTGYGGTNSSHYMYTGDPETNLGWTETSAGNPAGDRRFLMSSGPFTLPAHSKIEWGYAIVFSQDTTQAINTITEFHKRVQRDVRNIKYYDDTHQTPICKPAVVQQATGIKSESLDLKIFMYPNPATNFITIELTENVKTASVIISDVSGRKISEAQISNGYYSQVDVSALDKGIYFVEVNDGNRRSVEKLVKN